MRPRAHREGALLGIPWGTMAIGALFSVDGTVSMEISLGGAEMGNLIVSRESPFRVRTHGIFFPSAT